MAGRGSAQHGIAFAVVGKAGSAWQDEAFSLFGMFGFGAAGNAGIGAEWLGAEWHRSDGIGWAGLGWLGLAAIGPDRLGREGNGSARPAWHRVSVHSWDRSSRAHFRRGAAGEERSFIDRHGSVRPVADFAWKGRHGVRSWLGKEMIGVVCYCGAEPARRGSDRQGLDGLGAAGDDCIENRGWL